MTADMWVGVGLAALSGVLITALWAIAITLMKLASEKDKD